MIIYSALFASLALAQSGTGIITTHPLGAVLVQPQNVNLWDNPLGIGECSAPRPLQVQYNNGGVQSGTIGIYLLSGSTCTVTTLPAVPPNGSALLNDTLGTRPSPDYFPRTVDAELLSTKDVLDVSGLCAEDAAGANLAPFILCIAVEPPNAAMRIYDQIQFRVDTIAPAAPTSVVATPGNQRLNVGWTEATDDTSLKEFFVVVYDAMGNEITRQDPIAKGIGGGAIEGLTNDTTYSVVVYARDIAGNVSVGSEPITGTPVNTCDFWSCYPGRERGGFCFIATAAYGSYDAGFVRTFREFRDRVLLQTAWGTRFVEWYYKNGAAPARYIAAHPWAKNAAAAALVVPFLAVWPILHVSPWVMLGLPLVLLLAWRRKSWLLALALLLPSTDVFAQEMLERANADDPSSVKMQPPRWEIAVKLGPYQPNIDGDADSGGLYAEYFGDRAGGIFSKGSRVRVELSGDFYILNKWGLLGVTAQAAYWTANGFTRVCDAGACNTPEDIKAARTSGDSTTLNLWPLSIGVVYKFDWFWRKWKVPLVPFVRAGIDGVLWNVWAAGKQARKNNAVWGGATLQPNGFAQGITFGWHVNPGIALALDWIEPNAARRAYSFTGMKGSYLTFEWMFHQIDDFGSATSWDLSWSTFQAGIAIEF